MTFDGIYLQRFIIVLLVVFIIVSLLRKAGKFACFLISILCFMQIGFILGGTSLNDTIPFSDYFKYDVVKSITSIWNETDKEALKQQISDGINTGADITENTVDKAQEIINKYVEQNKGNGQTTEPTIQPEEIPIIPTE